MERSELLEFLASIDSCEDATEWLKARPQDESLEQTWEVCEDARWMLWLAAYLGVDQKLIVLITCDCADYAVTNHVPPKEQRPAEAIRVARQWCEGKATTEEVRLAHHAAWTARGELRKVSEAADSAASAAAEASTLETRGIADNAYFVAADAAFAFVHAITSTIDAADSERAVDAYERAIVDALRHMAGLIRTRLSAEQVKQAFLSKRANP
jgi:hypothetical protein